MLRTAESGAAAGVITSQLQQKLLDPTSMMQGISPSEVRSPLPCLGRDTGEVFSNRTARLIACEVCLLWEDRTRFCLSITIALAQLSRKQLSRNPHSSGTVSDHSLREQMGARACPPRGAGLEAVLRC